MLRVCAHITVLEMCQPPARTIQAGELDAAPDASLKRHLNPAALAFVSSPSASDTGSVARCASSDEDDPGREVHTSSPGETSMPRRSSIDGPFVVRGDSPQVRSGPGGGTAAVRPA